MDKFDRIYTLHTLFSKAREPLSSSAIGQQLDCSVETAQKLLKEMQSYLKAPIEYDRKADTYFYKKSEERDYELPGLWFNASELYALLVTHQLLTEVEPGLLSSHISPLKNKIEDLLHKEHGRQGELARRVRILKVAARRSNPKHFSLVATALLTRKRLFMEYQGRERKSATQREISPQRLVYYRDNWYLDAWCHLRTELRSFALERISASKLVHADAYELSEVELNQHYGSSYGIFSGIATQRARLKFKPEVAPWVAAEQWHPDQKGQFDIDGCYELEIPYRDARELIMDILKYGADVQVMGPEKLKNLVAVQLRAAAQLYQ